LRAWKTSLKLIPLEESAFSIGFLTSSENGLNHHQNQNRNQNTWGTLKKSGSSRSGLAFWRFGENYTFRWGKHAPDRFPPDSRPFWPSTSSNGSGGSDTQSAPP